MIILKKLHVSFLLVVLSVILIHLFKFGSQNLFTFETSVWCFSSSKETKLCKFKNICYDSHFKTFLFFFGEGTIIKGFNHYSELQKIQLSSVPHHNQFFANLSIVDTENYKLKKKFEIHPKALLFSRFKPNNLMHTIHDDLFPVFLTLESVCLGDLQCIENYCLIFHDNNPRGPFFNLYKLFSKKSPILLNELYSDSNDILCFNEMLTGLIIDGVFYQYGFKKPHGPIKPSQLTQGDISRFTSFVKDKLQISSKKNNSSEVILLTRLKNRKILNGDGVKQMIENAYQKLSKEIWINVIALDLFSNDLTGLIKIISQAKGLIGMHGAEMILSLFLNPNSYVIEIFPFGIKPEVVSFIKPISELDDCNFFYFSWKNMIKTNSVAHSDAHPLFGGISHLDETVQKKIKNAKEVPSVKCCNNPLFLYYMYQDTLISNEFEKFLFKILLKIHSHQITSERRQIIYKWLYPSSVFNFSCNFQFHRSLLHLSWKPPFNVDNNNIKFSLYVKDQKSSFSKEFATKNTSLQIEIPAGVNHKFEVWISVQLNSNSFRSPDLYMICDENFF